jgi:hypothetical protein
LIRVLRGGCGTRQEKPSLHQAPEATATAPQKSRALLRQVGQPVGSFGERHRSHRNGWTCTAPYHRREFSCCARYDPRMAGLWHRADTLHSTGYSRRWDQGSGDPYPTRTDQNCAGSGGKTDRDFGATHRGRSKRSSRRFTRKVGQGASRITELACLWRGRWPAHHRRRFFSP